MTFDSPIKMPDRAVLSPLICFSHLRWHSVFQRPQHLMSRFAKIRPTYFFEEPIEGDIARLQRSICPETNVRLVTPVMPAGAGPETLRNLLDQLMGEIGAATAWYYTPSARGFSRHVDWLAIVYDCMDELSAFRFAAPELKALEADLMRSADVVFTGGRSLYEARKQDHADIHCFPSGVDLAHFMAARGTIAEPADQQAIAGPKIGYFGVIDERLDLALLAGIAAARPDWSLVMIGPVAKLQPSELPQASNIHWLGARDYALLPAYLAHWDAALMPFALNEATRFISPTKAPEYLAGGKRVASTAIADVVSRYAGIPAVSIATDAPGFVAAIDAAIAQPGLAGFEGVDDLLADMSWDGIFDRMHRLVLRAEERHPVAPALQTRPAKLADALIVGAGFAGSVMAERLASSGQQVIVIDKRPHIAGNAYDEYDAAGLLVHRYGPHIFHTNSDEVLRYLSRFTQWHPYEHRVLSKTAHGLVPMPINRTTLNRIFDAGLRDEAATAAFLESLAEPVADIKNARDFVVTSVGRELYEKLFYGYTVKQWGVDPSELASSVTARVPTRTTDDDRYFLDRHQCMPLHGYTRMFANMLDHPNITVLTSTEFDAMPRDRFGHVVFTGPIDEYFNYRHGGALPYRSLVFEHETREAEQVQPVATINYPTMDTPYTRCTEFKHMTGQKHAMTSLCRERSSAEGEPYYPVPNAGNHLLYKRYEALADAEPNVTFLGRLGTYRYMNMDQVVGQALAAARRHLARTTETLGAAAE